ncbi:MAG: acyl-ACP desaturase [Armatimonadetes bacterium]|nr:acyl-ACP desaturase [Armatimonadota bacterium]
MTKISTQARMEDFFYRELLKYLYMAEQKRRWNPFTDIPYDHANPNSSQTLAQCVETFCAVEMYLPDFTSKMLHMIRRSRGRSWFHINWGYEESKHSLTLEGWLLASGHRTEEQRQAVEASLSTLEWELPYDHPRQMVCYTMIQELATFWNYRNLEKMAAKEKDLALVTGLRIISVDERVHYNFFRNTVKEWMKWDEAGTVEDLKYVFDHFSMPGRTQIPGYDEAAAVLAKTGIYGPREYIKLVKNPILEDLRLDKDFKKLEDREAQEEAERAEKAALESSVEKISLGNGHAVAKNGEGEGKHPFNSNAISKVLENLKPGGSKWDSRSDIPTYANGRKRSAFLDVVGIEPQVREAPSRSIILSHEAEKLRGSRGMDKVEGALDQMLMNIGDELSNNAEEMREERAQIQRERAATRTNRVKNNKLFRDSE